MHVAFDLDGVLLDSHADTAWLDRALSATLRSLGYPDTEQNRARLYPADRERFERAAGAFDASPERLWRERDGRYVESKIAAMEEGEIEPFPDVEALYPLADRHDLHVISNSPQEVVERFVEVGGYADLFSALIGRGSRLDDLPRMKPDPHPYRRLVAEIDEDAEIYVGDRDTDRVFAERVGMSFVHLTRGDGGARSLDEVRERLEGGN